MLGLTFSIYIYSILYTLKLYELYNYIHIYIHTNLTLTTPNYPLPPYTLRYDNPTHKGARHHPTKAFHLWRGESIVYIHALAILDAIFMIEGDLEAGKSVDTMLKGKWMECRWSVYIVNCIYIVGVVVYGCI